MTTTQIVEEGNLLKVISGGIAIQHATSQPIINHQISTLLALIGIGSFQID
ncbi:hypothetical protein SAMN00120144_3224 [Hymenobacter roseosalivarius DSM 11622]|uniref:Uncharacterized protein n=1 Tax=Hymenobacter roseosalivarius DSM 11622 TaxID=645990 RepID=A0A1W1W4V0_9BACT|nr:hypothetical protein SAMN00120144_3224 [Hymenobacter roseosalivarius DSM 11622]